jgi:hypothetical protein
MMGEPGRAAASGPTALNLPGDISVAGGVKKA